MFNHLLEENYKKQRKKGEGRRKKKWASSFSLLPSSFS
jgi:hypothetical protein